MRLAAFLLLVIFAAGCRHAPLSYSIVASGPRIAVKPPVPVSAEIRITKARKRARPNCDIESGFANLRWNGKTARIQLHAAQFFDDPGSAPPGVVLGTDRMYTDSLQDLNTFRSAMFARAADGCFTAEERIDILKTMVERSQVDPLIAYFLRFGTFSQTGFIELTADFRLKVVSPASSGAEIAYYDIVPAPRDDRIRLVPASSEAAPLQGLPQTSGYIRVLFWTSLSSADHYATLLASPDHAALEDATRQFQSQPDASCRGRFPAGVTCVPVPPDSAVNAQMRVKLNGEDAFVGIGGRLGEAIPRALAPSGALPAGTQIWRIFRGKPILLQFDPERRDVFQLVLLPGDAIVVPRR